MIIHRVGNAQGTDFVLSPEHLDVFDTSGKTGLQAGKPKVGLNDDETCLRITKRATFQFGVKNLVVSGEALLSHLSDVSLSAFSFLLPLVFRKKNSILIIFGGCA